LPTSTVVPSSSAPSLLSPISSTQSDREMVLYASIPGLFWLRRVSIFASDSTASARQRVETHHLNVAVRIGTLSPVGIQTSGLGFEPARKTCLRPQR
jgi:hypothetical protein